MVPPVDDTGHKVGRRLVVVWTRGHAANRRRSPEVFRNWSSRMCGGLRHFGLQSVEKAQPSATPLPNRTSLLVESAASGPVFLSLRPHDDGVLGGAGSKLLLSLAGRAAVLFGYQYCGFAGCAGDAFLERRVGGHGSGRGAGMRIDYDFCVAGLGLDGPPAIAYEPL